MSSAILGPRRLNPCLRGLSTVALLLLSFLARPSARAQNHLYTDQSGRRYDAAPLDLDNDQVTFQRPDGSTFTLAVQDLINDDQQAVHDWFYAQPAGIGERPPPTQRLSPFGRSFVLDEPRVLRLRPLPGKGYASSYLGIPITIRNDWDDHLEFFHLYFYDVNRKLRPYPLIPAGSSLMVQSADTTAFVNPHDFKVGQTYMVLFPIQEPASATATYVVVVAGNAVQPVALVYPSGSWRDFDFPEHDLLAADKYADFSAQELYPEKFPSDLFDITEVTRLRPLTGNDTADHDFFRLGLHIKVPLPAAALSAQWYAFDKQHNLIHSAGDPPYTHPGRADIFNFIVLPGHGPADISDAILPTTGTAFDTLELPDASWWSKPEVDSIVFVFGTETKKVARVFSKSGATFTQLPVPEKSAFGAPVISTETSIPEHTY